MNRRPIACITSALRPSDSVTTTLPAPGVPGGKFTARSSRGVCEIYGMISLRSQAWLPSVITSAPAANNAAAMSGPRPKPCDAFSAFTTVRSTRNAARSPGRDAATVSRPVRPTTSPSTRMRIQLSLKRMMPRSVATASSRISVGPTGTASISCAAKPNPNANRPGNAAKVRS